MWGVFSCGMDFECRLSDRAMLCCTIFYLSWLILDNIDGKQARRTGSSSPLGLMFDHQVDALNVTITSTYLVNVLMAPQSALIYWFVGAFPFYYTTWEETYTGAQNFPYFSAASDGCLAIGLLSFIFYLFSPEFFIHNSILGLEIREFLLLLLIIGVFLISLYK